MISLAKAAGITTGPDGITDGDELHERDSGEYEPVLLPLLINAGEYEPEPERDKIIPGTDGKPVGLPLAERLWSAAGSAAATDAVSGANGLTAGILRGSRSEMRAI